jgi:diaminohydroxyphosphoribosylaminopyrimidine deaminase/5-amino-6-(5-phosphoribosylamino)uracil reductase
MRRCLQLAAKGTGYVSPNPLVGAVLVYRDKILGEGWHSRYGAPHAEVNCLVAVKDQDRHLIPFSTLYVSLEPCDHFGKTPPCSQFILQHQIKNVVIACRDPFSLVNGKGIKTLTNSGVSVIQDILQEEASFQNRRFFTFCQHKRPFIVLKWAETADGFIAPTVQHADSERWIISNKLSERFVHRLRAEQAAILVGTATLKADNPTLDNRYAEGPSPIKMTIDKALSIKEDANFFCGNNRKIIFNCVREGIIKDNVQGVRMPEKADLTENIINWCYQNHIQSILVEGGRKTLEYFINHGYWDECVQITATDKAVGKGLPAPALKKGSLQDEFYLVNDRVRIWKK